MCRRDFQNSIFGITHHFRQQALLFFLNDYNSLFLSFKHLFPPNTFSLKHLFPQTPHTLSTLLQTSSNFHHYHKNHQQIHAEPCVVNFSLHFILHYSTFFPSGNIRRICHQTLKMAEPSAKPEPVDPAWQARVVAHWQHRIEEFDGYLRNVKSDRDAMVKKNLSRNYKPRVMLEREIEDIERNKLRFSQYKGEPCYLSHSRCLFRGTQPFRVTNALSGRHCPFSYHLPLPLSFIPKVSYYKFWL